jgi:hypothetical protein
MSAAWPIMIRLAEATISSTCESFQSQRSTLNAAGSPTCMRAGARSWMADLVEGRVNSFEEIARSENKVERHIPYLAPLAVSPRIVEASHCQR